jgi:hypothetical protein
VAKKNNGQSKVPNKQKQLADAIESVPGDKMNQNHNAKKEALGPNTRR